MQQEQLGGDVRVVGDLREEGPNFPARRLFDDLDELGRIQSWNIVRVSRTCPKAPSATILCSTGVKQSSRVVSTTSCWISVRMRSAPRP